MVVLQQRNTQTLCWGGQLCLLSGACKPTPRETWASVDTSRQKGVRMKQTNMRGSSVSLENMEMSKEIHRKSEFISSRGEDTEVTMWLLQKGTVFNVCGNRTSSNGFK